MLLDQTGSGVDDLDRRSKQVGGDGPFAVGDSFSLSSWATPGVSGAGHGASSVALLRIAGGVLTLRAEFLSWRRWPVNWVYYGYHFRSQKENSD